ncbi:MAG: hypothetical protein WC637_05205 [Victivallales bacterium]
MNGELRAIPVKTDVLKHFQMRDFSLFSNLDGAVDDVKIYNKALDASTIKKLYNTTPKP